MANHDFRARRLYVAVDIQAGAEIVLDREQSDYLLKVLRLGSGAIVFLFNGRDGEWRARLETTAHRKVSLLVEAQTRPQTAAG